MICFDDINKEGSLWFAIEPIRKGFDEVDLTECFGQQEIAEIQKCNLDKRRMEKVSGKLLVKELWRSKGKRISTLPSFQVLSDGHPVKLVFESELINHVHANITHSGEWVGACISQFRCGIDIEKIKILKDGILDFFLTASQREQMTKELGYSNDSIQSAKTAVAVFSLKESVLKAEGCGIAGGMKNVEFDRFEENEWVKATYRDSFYRAKFEFFDTYVLSIAEELRN